MTLGLLDSIDTWLLLVLVLVLFAGVSEVGLRIARRSARTGEEDREAKRALSGMVLGAVLALLGLLLAFSFSIAEGRLAARKRLVIREANAIGTAYLRAELLPAPHDERVRRLLASYLDRRLALSPDDLDEILAHSARTHEALWRETAAAAAIRDTPLIALFVTAVNDVVDVHSERVTVGLYQRLPPPFLWMLLAVGACAMAILGYHAGSSGARSRAVLPMSAVILATSFVVVLVIEMDRPWGSVFAVSQRPLAEARASMDVAVGAGAVSDAGGGALE